MQIMRGEYGKEVGNAAEQLTASMDKLISGCFRGFEQSYNKLERAIRESMDWRKNGTGAPSCMASGCKWLCLGWQLLLQLCCSCCCSRTCSIVCRLLTALKASGYHTCSVPARIA